MHWTKYKLDEQDGVFNWDRKTPGLPILFTQVLQSSTSVSGNLSDWRSKAEDYLDSIVERRSSGRMTKGAFIPFAILHTHQNDRIGGLLYYNGDSDDASLNPALNAAMLLTRYAPYASSTDKRAAYLVSSLLLTPRRPAL